MKYVSILIMFIFLLMCSYALFSGLAAFSQLDLGMFSVSNWNNGGRFFFGLFAILCFVFSVSKHTD